jgi:hypothetical protein
MNTQELHLLRIDLLGEELAAELEAHPWLDDEDADEDQDCQIQEVE